MIQKRDQDSTFRGGPTNAISNGNQNADFVGAIAFALAIPKKNERVAAFLKRKLKDTEVTYAELAKRLRKQRLKETEASITNKLARGTFPATFLLACIAALELERVALEAI